MVQTLTINKHFGNISSMNRKIITYPNPILDQPTTDITFPLDAYTKEVIQDLWQLVQGQGVGLAAPQIGEPLNMCIISLSENPEEAKKSKLSDFLMINPSITFYSQVSTRMIEGCLSFPDQWYYVTRPANIAVEYYDQDGKKHILKAKNWISRIIQHEVDHLQGKVFINHPTAKRIDPSEFE
jgi:peptide deformylase